MVKVQKKRKKSILGKALKNGGLWKFIFKNTPIPLGAKCLIEGGGF